MGGLAAILITVIAWSGEFLLVRAATAEAHPLLVAAVVYLVSGVLLTLFCKARRIPETREAAKNDPRARRNWLLLIALLGCGINLTWIWGTKLTGVASASALGRADALFTLMLATFIFGEKVPRRAWLFVPIMLGGVVILTNITPQTLLVRNMGDIMILASAFLLSLNAFFIKRLMRFMPGPAIARWNSLIMGLAFTLICAAMYGFTRLPRIPAGALAAMAACGALGALAFVGYYAALRIMDAWLVRMLLLSIPVAATLGEWIFWSEAPGFRRICGALLIICGAAGIMSACKTGKAKPRPTAISAIEKETKHECVCGC